ncbi:ribonuclease domain-containing protein [Dermatophilaceae bacterium Soc4.6]
MHLSPRTRAWATLVVALAVVLLAILLPRLTAGSTSAEPTARTSVSPRTSVSTRTSVSPRTTPTGTSVAESDLDGPARATLALVRAGGPFPYPRNDGVTYHNANRVLPIQRDGYYTEYTVPTPGSSSRGARRIIAGQGGDYYYTRDHYDSFARIRLGA